MTGRHITYSRAAARTVLLTFDPISNLVFTRFIDPRTGRDDFAAELRST